MQDRIPDGRGGGEPSHLRALWGTATGKITIVFTLVTTLGIGFAGGYFSAPKSTKTVNVAQTSPKQTQNTPAPGVPGTGSTTATVPTTADSATDPGTPQSSDPAQAPGLVPSPTGSAPVAGTVSLVNLTPVVGPFDNNDTNPVINGKAQLEAITQSLGCGSKDAGYNLSREYTQFNALLGVDDNSRDATVKPSVEIDGDGLKLATYTPTLGHPVQISVNVSGVLRLDILWTDPGAECYYNGPSGILVFGQSELTTVPGYKPSPAATTR